jgi:hypothetical protein
MGQRQHPAADAEGFGFCCGCAVELYGWHACWAAGYFDVCPGDAFGKAGAEGFGYSFFGGKTGGIVDGWVSISLAVGALVLGEGALFEALSVPL